MKKKPGLHQYSDFYYDKASLYDFFSQTEDYPQKVLKFLIPRVKEKTVLDLGCGTGKYTALLSPHAKEIIGIDQSKQQLNLARKKTAGLANVKLQCNFAHKIKLPDNYADVVIATWVLGTINNQNTRIKVINEALRILKKNGIIYLVENDKNSEFEIIRGRLDDPCQRTKNYNDWLVDCLNFKIEKRFTTYFKFNTLIEAQNIIRAIWGLNAAEKVTRRILSQKIVVFELRK
jgi:ubiquinone/menaquinone biosynthesis C-methylase UbiE